jgi:glycosyltransferase involved in cell wall biosynthesis
MQKLCAPGKSPLWLFQVPCDLDGECDCQERRTDFRMINILSPVPPAKTGTANYLRLLLRDMRDFFAERPVRLFAEPAYPIPASCHGVEVHSVSAFLPEPGDTNIFAIANNEFHHYVIQKLIRGDVEKCRNISLIHDLQILQNLTGMHLGQVSKIDIDEFARCFDPEVSSAMSPIEFAKAIKNGQICRTLHFTLLGQDEILRKSSDVLVHNYYAKNKILLECGLDIEQIPRLHVVRHPEEDPPEQVDCGRQEGGFRVGCFGWVGEYKRVHSAIRAFAELADSNPRFRADARLTIAGQLPPPQFFDPEGLARRLGVNDLVTFTGFLAHEAFLAEMARTNLLLNLRYPSCGETSGALFAGRAMSRQIAVSSYQSFREESANFHISVHPGYENEDLKLALQESFEAWRQCRASSLRPSRELPKASVAHVLADLLS